MGPKILVTGSTGQIGSELVPALRQKYGPENVVAGILPGLKAQDIWPGPEEYFDVTDKASLLSVLKKHRIDTVYHLAAILSAVIMFGTVMAAASAGMTQIAPASVVTTL